MAHGVLVHDRETLLHSRGVLRRPDAVKSAEEVGGFGDVPHAAPVRLDLDLHRDLCAGERSRKKEAAIGQGRRRVGGRTRLALGRHRCWCWKAGGEEGDGGRV